MIHFDRYSKSYGDHLILKINSLELKPGVYWVLGENGSGKTTFFKTIAGLLPFEGDIRFTDGVTLTSQPVEFRSRVNYGEAEPLYPGFVTAKDLIGLVGHAKKAPLAQQQKLTALLGIDQFFEKPCETFSSGMIKKLSLALTFLGDPDVLILDEPLITLDLQARKNLLELVQSARTERERVILLSSHQSLDWEGLTITKSYQVTNKTLHEIGS